MQDRPTERVRVLLDGLTASAIVDRVHPYYSGYQFEGEWLDTLKESIEGELDDLDRTIRGRAGTVGAVDRLREYVANAPASSMGEMARAIVRNYCDAIEVEAGDPTGARRFAERLEAAASERADVTLFGVDYTPLPVDAEGVPVRVGDVMNKGEVTCIRDCGKGWEVVLDNLYTYDAPSLRHRAPSVEDVLREFGDWYAHTKGGCDEDGIIAEYAAKLALRGDE